MHFLEWKCLNFDSNFTEVCSHGSNQQYSITASDNGLAPARRQAIIWTDDGQFFRRIYASLGLNELTCQTNVRIFMTNNDISNEMLWLKCASKAIFILSAVKNSDKLAMCYFYSSPPSAAYMRQWIGPALVQIMPCRLFGAKPLSKPMLDYCQLDP